MYIISDKVSDREGAEGMELTIELDPELRGEIERHLRNGMMQTALYLTIKQLKEQYDLRLPHYNCMRMYALAKAVLRKKFPEFFPQMRLSL